MNTAHGESVISVTGNVITVKVKGVFNKEGVCELNDELRLIISSYNVDGFKMLFNYLEVEGATPDAYDQIDNFNVWLNNQNMIAKAVVIISPAVLNILNSRAPARKSKNMNSFSSTIKAIQWLDTQS
jgi:hypothetical protein